MVLRAAAVNDNVTPVASDDTIVGLAAVSVVITAGNAGLPMTLRLAPVVPVQSNAVPAELVGLILNVIGFLIAPSVIENNMPKFIEVGVMSVDA